MPELVELAEHWWEANAWSETLHASIRAGDAMAALLAMPEAYAHYGHAIVACEHLADDEGRHAIDYVDLLLKTADVAYLAGEARRSVELVALAIDELDGTDARRAAVAYTMFGRNAWANGDADVLTAERRRQILASVDGLAAEALRTLGVALHGRLTPE